MSTAALLMTPTQNSDAEFRAWVSDYIAGMVAAGLVQTSDTGQINTATVVRPAAGAMAGYVIMRMNDTLQASAPIYIRVDFGAGNSGVQYMSTWLTIGKASDGAGNLGAILLPQTQLGRAVAGVSTRMDGIATGGEGYAAILPLTGWATFQPIWFIIERSRDTSGVPTGQGLMVVLQSSISNGSGLNYLPTVRAINYTTAATNTSVPPVCLPYQIGGQVMAAPTSISAGGISPVFPWVIIAPGLAPWQSLLCMTYPTGDNPQGVFTSRVFGVDHSYQAVPFQGSYYGFGTGIAPSTSAGGHNQGGLAVLWE